MTAKVKPGMWGKWLARCNECREGTCGTMAQVDLWADVHNETCREEPHFGCPDCGEREGCACRWHGVL